MTNADKSKIGPLTQEEKLARTRVRFASAIAAAREGAIQAQLAGIDPVERLIEIMSRFPCTYEEWQRDLDEYGWSEEYE